MTLHLRDIIDLDFLLSLDETNGDTAEDTLSERDREIFAQINQPDLTEEGLVARWLYFRKLLFFHETSPAETLPGELFSSLLGWAYKCLFLAGLVLGFGTAFSFLAYHGTRPVNVTLFASVFILVPALLSCLALGIMACRALGLTRQGPGLFQTLASGAFFNAFGRAWEKAETLPGGKSLKAVSDAAALIRACHRDHQGIMVWPFFILSSLFALGFSSSALFSVLFRVAVSDIAFGWQSTLVTSGAIVHDLVSWIALPWSWALPQALPGPEQIEGSRIILKEGIQGLSTGDLTAWWPFLAMGLLVYGVIFRLCLVAGGFRGLFLALSRVDLNRPQYRRLLARMQTPRMQTREGSGQVSRAAQRFPLPRPEQENSPGGERHGHGAEKLGQGSALPADAVPQGSAAQGALGKVPGEALILASETAYPDDIRDVMATLAAAQLDIRTGEGLGLSMDFDRDRPGLKALADNHGNGPVLFLQEVWQPPTRGLLHYINQVKSEIFPHTPLWIILTQTPGQGDPGVAGDDINFKVWKTAVAQMKDPGIVPERILP